jgi:hypothetical protein
MNRILMAGASILLIGAAAYFLVPQLNRGDVFIPGGKPVNDEQVREKLQSDGWGNVQIRRQGRYIVALGSKDGQEEKFWVNSEDGHLRVFDDDEYPDEDDDN